MPRCVAFTFAMLLTAAAVAAEESIPALIDRLADPEPAVRRSAYDKLRALGAQAVPALRVAARGPHPAIADAAADLVLASTWWTAQDHPDVRKILSGYGQRSVAERTARVTRLVVERQPDFRAVAVRVVNQDPSDEVGWQALDSVEPDTRWEKALSAADPASLAPSLSVLLAKAKERRGDVEGAVALVRRVIDQEQERPVATGRWLTWAYATAVDADVRAGRFDAAAGWLRDQIARTGDGSDVQLVLIDQLLDLHARHGPLPGFAADLRLSDVQGEPHGTFAVAHVAHRVGLPVAGASLLGATLAPRPDESDPERAARIGDAADWLTQAGHLDTACRAWDQVTAIEAPSARGYVMLAYLRLSQLHAAAGRPLLAGDALQRAIERQDGPLVINRKNRPAEQWLIEDEQARVYWYYLLDARARGDAEAIQKQSRLLVASGSTDSGLFLDALPSLEASATPDEVDAYFTRVLDRAKTRAEAAPQDPVYWNDVAWLCARSGRHVTEAVGWAEQAVKLSPEPAYLDTLAEAKFRTGKIQEAIALEKQAIDEGPGPEDGAFMRAQLDRFEKAATTRPGE